MIAAIPVGVFIVMPLLNKWLDFLDWLDKKMGIEVEKKRRHP
jgi:hypothetical protein